MIAPRRFQGRNQYEIWANELLDYVVANQLQESPDIRWERSPRGTAGRVNRFDTSSQKPKPYLLTSIKDNHLLCQPMILNDAGDDIEADPDADAVYIAKPFDLRVKRWDGQTIDGITYQFLDDNPDGSTDSTKRTATTNSPAVTENQRITPYYVEGVSVIRAMEVTLTGLTVQTDPGDPANNIPPTLQTITLEEVSARAWAKV